MLKLDGLDDRLPRNLFIAKKFVESGILPPVSGILVQLPKLSIERRGVVD
jgi:hypothetical protein